MLLIMKVILIQMKYKILILGSKGMLGKALREEFKDSEVFALDKEDLDITNESEVRNKLLEIKPEIVINATAINAVDNIESDDNFYQLAKEVNGLAVGKLASICKDLDIVLVHYSSDHVFAGDDENGYTEDARVKPVNKYGESKALGEKELLDNTDKFYLIRLSKLFGLPGESEMTKKSFVDIMLDLVVNKEKKELDLVDDERSIPTYAPDLALLTHQLLLDEKPFGIYHGANSGTCTWYEFGQEIFKNKNLSVKLNPVPADKFPRPAARPHFSELLNTKLKKQRNWREALKEYLQII